MPESLPTPRCVFRESVTPILERFPESPSPRVSPCGDIFIVRRDRERVVNEWITRTGGSRAMSEGLESAYAAFEAEVLASISRHFARTSPKLEIHSFDAAELESAARKKARGLPIISLDPLVNREVDSLQVSRLYALGGEKSLGLSSRPGAASIDEQISALRAKHGNQPLALVDDDLFSGGTAAQVVDALGLNIEVFIPQVQAGDAEPLKAREIQVRPVVDYRPMLSHAAIDVGDVRDFLMGASGLAVELPSGRCGRAPYFLPFISPTARASISVEREEVFSREMLAANLSFIDRAEIVLGKPLRLLHCEAPFREMMQEVYGFESTTELSEIIHWADRDLANIRSHTLQLGRLREWTKDVELPQRLIFIDVNGTLIPEDAESLCFDRSELDEFRGLVRQFEKEGVGIGLCSDSPLAELEKLASALGLPGPHIAENGQVVSLDGVNLNLSPQFSPSKTRALIEEHIPLEFRRVPDCSAREFGGKQPEYDRKEWAFGAGREASVSLFGPAELINALSGCLKGRELSIDFAPEHNFLGAHPVPDYRQAKSQTLRKLVSCGRQVWMIGNSMSDWSAPECGVRSAFVSDSRIDSAVAAKAVLGSKPLLAGVNEILNNLRN